MIRLVLKCTLAAILPLVGFACGGSDLVLPNGHTPPARITIVKGDAQAGPPGTMLHDSIVVRVTDSTGSPLAGQRVEFDPDAPGAAVTPQASTTGANGLAGARWVLGPTVGPQEVVARIVAGSDQLRVSFTATAKPDSPEPAQPPGGANQPPTAVSDEYATLEGHDHVLTVSAAGGVLQNDRDPEAGSLTASSAGNPPNGEVTLEADGSFSYAPDPDFFGDDRFTYTARDGAGNGSSATVTIHVAPVNDPPGFYDRGDPSRVGTDAGPQTVRAWATSIHPGAENESNQTVEFLVTGNSNPGLFTPGGQPRVTRDGARSREGTLRYTPSGQSGSATITLVLRDNGGTNDGGVDTSAPHTFTIRVRR